MAKKRATLDDLLEKARRTKEIELSPNGPSVLFQAISSKDYDDLIAKHPPSAKQKKDEAVWNPDTFAPALIAACSKEPEITNDTALEIWQSDSWSRGELMDIFMAVVTLNSEGLNVPFSGKD